MNILIVVDMQNDFVSGALGTPEARRIVPAAAERVAAGIRRGERIFFTRDTHGADYLHTREGRNLPVPHCIRGTEGWEIVEQAAARRERHRRTAGPIFRRRNRWRHRRPPTP